MFRIFNKTFTLEICRFNLDLASDKSADEATVNAVPNVGLETSEGKLLLTEDVETDGIVQL